MKSTNKRRKEDHRVQILNQADTATEGRIKSKEAFATLNYSGISELDMALPKDYFIQILVMDLILASSSVSQSDASFLLAP